MLPIPLHDFADRLNEIIPVIMKEFSQRQTNELFKGAITLPQFVILNYLKRQGRSKMTDIAHFMGATTAAATGVVNRLVKSGYVRRARHSKDRRVIFIALKPKGSKLVKRVESQRRQMILHIFGRISEEERENYLNILTHIRDILTRQKQKMEPTRAKGGGSFRAECPSGHNHPRLKKKRCFRPRRIK